MVPEAIADGFGGQDVRLLPAVAPVARIQRAGEDGRERLIARRAGPYPGSNEDFRRLIGEHRVERKNAQLLPLAAGGGSPEQPDEPQAVEPDVLDVQTEVHAICVHGIHGHVVDWHVR